MEYGSVIFDLDGVILNSMESEEWKYQATRDALEELGVDQNLDREVLDAILGDKGYEECVRVCGDIGVDPRKAWSLVAEKTAQARMQQIEENGFGLIDGAEELLQELKENQVKLGVISNAPDQAVEMVVDYFDLRSYFKFYMGVRSFEDLKARKPHPNHLELAKFQLKRDPYIYVGDHESDVQAATNAEMDSVWVHPENLDEPTYTVDKLSEIVSVINE
ncbi:HAD family hydrolase [Candidatus Nanohalobium constans]|uniref:HAD-superfamily hydrolase n=1 Tax=Candidatus Nanohalobium constans TaxID=2565781 RepID=A0A5Q0UFV1_9ARCH|nr:HAD family hydrolase [Candidatus Nanohalobium constans]QGA80467.1 HAD-superfamily hydrolase [Candidatus Nanohalobium constans]